MSTIIKRSCEYERLPNYLGNKPTLGETQPTLKRSNSTSDLKVTTGEKTRRNTVHVLSADPIQNEKMRTAWQKAVAASIPR